jgi:hypothetical protein
MRPTHQLFVDVDGVNLRKKNESTIKKSTEVLLDLSKEISLKAKAEKYKCTLMSRVQFVGQNQNRAAADRSSENVVKVQEIGKNSNKSILHLRIN